MRLMAGRVSQNLVMCGHPTKMHAKTGTTININRSSPTFLFKTFQLSRNSSRLVLPILIRSPLPLRIACQPNSNNPSNDDDDDDSGVPNKQISKRVAVVTCFAALGLFLSSRFDFGVSLTDLTALALPYDQALSNGKPTVVEFYADWCEVCRELAPQVYKVEQQYQDRVNFVMLNVDNTKWEQEIDEFGVEGIPHFAFLDKDGNEQGNVVGRLPPQYFLDNVDALACSLDSLPHARLVGLYSNTQARRVHQVADPRSHG